MSQMNLSFSQEVNLEVEGSTQKMLAFKEMLKNIITFPYSLIKNSGFRLRYPGYYHLENSLIYEIEENDFKLFDKTEIYAKNFYYEESKDLFQWETFLKDQNHYKKLKCEHVCPVGLKSLGISAHRTEANPKNYLSFTNTEDDFKDTFRKDFGFCWGFTATLDDFNYLAFFDPKNEVMNYEIPVAGTREWVKFYRKLIIRVGQKKLATVIPGFKNLREMSEHPKLKKAFKIRVAKRWANNALKISNVKHLIVDGRSMPIEKIQKLLIEIKRKLLTHQSPRIIFSAHKNADWSHVLNVYGMKTMNDGSVRLFVFETNYKPETVTKNSQYFEIRPDGEIHYGPLLKSRIGATRVGTMGITREDNKNAVQYSTHLGNFCRIMSECED
jgi:hypothetical protein